MKGNFKRKLLIGLICFVIRGNLFGQESENIKSYTPPATSFHPMITVLGIYMPENDMVDMAIPYFMPMLGVRFSHRFTEYKKRPELTFIADGELAPLWIRSGAQLNFKPASFITFSAGGDIGTSWGFDTDILSLDFIGEYNDEKNEYEYFSPFTHWVYDGWAQVGIQYDIASLLTKGKQHLILAGNYRSTYKGMTGVKNGQVWLNQGVGEEANGWTFKASASINYMIPNKYLKSVGLSATASSYYSDKFFDEKYRICEPEFLDLTFSFNSSASLGQKNRFMLMIPYSGKRDMASEKNLRPVTKPEGRKWQIDGIILTFTHIF